MDWENCLKKIIRDAGIIFFLTILLNELSNNEFIFYEETAIYFLNYIVKYGASCFFNEQEE